MVRLSLPIPAEQQPASSSQAAATETATDAVLVAGFGDGVAADYVAHVWRQSQMTKALYLDVTGGLRSVARTPASTLILFLKPSLNATERNLVWELLRRAANNGVRFVGIVSSFRVHLDDSTAAAIETQVRERARSLALPTVVFRPGHVLSPTSAFSARLRRWSFCYPLVPARLRSCFVAGEELFQAIENERRRARPARDRVVTLLGPNRPWRELLRENLAGWWRYCLTAVSALLSLLLVGHILAAILDLLLCRRHAWRCWNFDTLYPHSLRELLSLYNKYNYRSVKVVGYNNGVSHFGHRYPGKTVVSTVHCNRVVRAGPDAIKVDCGTTIHAARQFLAGARQDLYVVPNYSYVCLGTAFFIPIHGSAAECSTVADTITRAILYDPVRERFIVAGRLEPAFGDYAYNLAAEVLLLRLTLRVKTRSRYHVECRVLDGPSSDEVMKALVDEQATNVEVRKAGAAENRVKVFKYYSAAGAPGGLELELPRDSLGSLWDRLEENPVTSFLMHVLTRYFAWHVELFFTAEEFTTFWNSHQSMPLRKIQLRHVRRDGLPHSPFRDHDCVAADMFLLRRHRRRFESYLKRTFAVVRSNPGKHSR